MTTEAHEGDSTLYVELASLVMGANDHWARQDLTDKINIAYTRYAITIQQWGRLYNLLNGEDPDSIPDKEAPMRNLSPVYPSIQTHFDRENGNP